MPERLLVVEDSKPIAKVISQIGKALNFDVVVASSLAETEKILQGDSQFFAATIDYALPDAMDGEAIECVLSHGVPGIVITGKMDETTRQKILSQPVIDYIPKENSQAFLYLKRVLHWQRANQGSGVLVVDDSVAARSHIVELLKRRNFTTYVADNGVKALEIIKQYPNIKMVITDLEMPEMDGITLTSEIRKHYHRDNLSVIGISGATSGVHSARFIKNGADDFLRKPFCPEEFYCRITQNIESLHNIEQIKRAANTDYLTDLPNRRAFFHDANINIEKYRANRVPFAIAMLDVDHFKRVNDQYGHEAGDHVLKAIALFLRKHIKSGIIARLGGEEFAILLAGIDKDQILTKLDDLRADISITPLSYNDQQLNINVSIGVCFNSTEELTQQINQADNALYYAKENGRNQLAVSGEDNE